MKRIDQEKIEGIIEKYKKQISIKDIATYYNISATTVIKYLSAAGY